MGSSFAEPAKCSILRGLAVRLGEWRRSAGLTLDAMGNRLGVGPETVRRYESGQRIPSRQHMARIYLATGGAVAPNDFYDLPALPEGPQGAGAAIAPISEAAA